jgi:hypothetical protein
MDASKHTDRDGMNRTDDNGDSLPLVDGHDLEDDSETPDNEIEHGRPNGHTGIDSHLSASLNGGLSTVLCSHSVDHDGEEFVGMVDLTIDVGEIELGTSVPTDAARELAEEILARADKADREAKMNDRQLENGR